MKRVISSCLLLFVLGGLGFGQTDKDKPKLLGFFGANDDDALNHIYKLGMTVESTFNPQEDIFAVRVCSNDPLPVALAMAKGAPFLATFRLEQLGIPKSRMYYLRQNKNCNILPNNYTFTDYWRIPKDAEFPEFVEARRASHLSGHELTRADFLPQEETSEIRYSELATITPQSYKMVLDKVIGLMKQNKSAVIVMRVPYYRISPTVELDRRVRETRTFLKANGIANHRVYIRKIFSGNKITSPEDEPKYPDIMVVGEG